MATFRFLRSGVLSRRPPGEPLNMPMTQGVGRHSDNHGDPLDIPFDLNRPLRIRDGHGDPLDMPLVGGSSRPWSEEGSTPLDLPVNPPDEHDE
jgi:hypothetical protein